MHGIEARLLLEGGQSISSETAWFTAMTPFIISSIISTAYKWRKWKHSNTDWPKMRGSVQTQWTGWGRRWKSEGESGGIGRKDGLDEWSGLWRFRCGTPQLSLEHAAEYGEWEEKWQTRNYRLWKKGWVGSEE